MLFLGKLCFVLLFLKNSAALSNEKIDLSKVSLNVVPDKYVEDSAFTLNCKISLLPNSRNFVYIIHNEKEIVTFKIEGKQITLICYFKNISL